MAVEPTSNVVKLGRQFLSVAEKYDDGTILRATFIAMLVGTIGVLAIDFFELNASDVEQPAYVPLETPILPAIDRPEVDPDNPSFSPQTQVTIDPEVLKQPVQIGLQAGGILHVVGAITPGATQLLAKELELRGDYIEHIFINSPGGVVDEALQMGAIIRAAELPTTIPTGAFCASSCPLIFAGGVERIAETGAVIGVHQVYAATGTAPSAAQSLSDAQAITGRITRFLVDMGVDPELWIHALETPPDKLYYLTEEELKKFSLVTEGDD